MINRHTRSPSWTPEQDSLLQKLEREGLPPAKIAARLDITPSAVQRRSHHLRGLEFPTLPRVGTMRADVKSHMRHHNEVAALAAMRAAISKGIPRDHAIVDAYKAGATHQAIAHELGVTKQRVHQIVLWQEALKSTA